MSSIIKIMPEECHKNTFFLSEWDFKVTLELHTFGGQGCFLVNMTEKKSTRKYKNVLNLSFPLTRWLEWVFKNITLWGYFFVSYCCILADLHSVCSQAIKTLSLFVPELSVLLLLLKCNRWFSFIFICFKFLVYFLIFPIVAKHIFPICAFGMPRS